MFDADKTRMIDE